MTWEELWLLPTLVWSRPGVQGCSHLVRRRELPHLVLDQKLHCTGGWVMSALLAALPTAKSLRWVFILLSRTVFKLISKCMIVLMLLILA